MLICFREGDRFIKGKELGNFFSERGNMFMEKTRDTDKALRMVFKMVPYINGRTYKGTKEVGMMT